MSTKLVTTDTEKIAFGEVRNGLQGNLEIAVKMVELVRTASVYDKGFERFVKQLLKKANLNSHSQKQLTFKYIYDFVKSHVSYIQDAYGSIEFLKTARQTLSDGFGDCDDNAVLIASMLAVVGFNPAFVLARYDKTHESYTHIYVACYDNDTRYVFDTTLENGELNTEIPAIATKEIFIFDYIPELDGVTGFIKQAKGTIQASAKHGLDILPKAMSLLPFGFGYVASKALETGAGMISHSFARGLTYQETATTINRQLDAILRRLYAGEITITEAREYANANANRLLERKAEKGAGNVEAINANLQAKLNEIYNFGTTANTNGLPVFELDSKKGRNL